MATKIKTNTQAKSEAVAVVKKVASKTAAKKVVAKVATKKAPTKAKAQRVKSAGLVCASDAECFWTTDGRVLKNLEDLVFAFGSMDDTAFVYHANEHKNDFAEWVEHVLQDASCAADLRKSTTKKHAHTVTKKHLKKATA